jgi:hypothetical protein
MHGLALQSIRVRQLVSLVHWMAHGSDVEQVIAPPSHAGPGQAIDEQAAGQALSGDASASPT